LDKKKQSLNEGKGGKKKSKMKTEQLLRGKIDKICNRRENQKKKVTQEKENKQSEKTKTQ